MNCISRFVEKHSLAINDHGHCWAAGLRLAGTAFAIAPTVLAVANRRSIPIGLSNSDGNSIDMQQT
jgi:hypothetical protein